MTKRPCASAQTFVRHHLGNGIFAPFTGQDFAAFQAFAHLCELYCFSDTAGRASCLKAMSATLACAQRSTWPAFAKCIPHSLDWSDEARIWALIAPSPIAQMSSIADPSRCRSTHPDNASVLCSDDAGHAGDHSYRGRSWK